MANRLHSHCRVIGLLCPAAVALTGVLGAGCVERELVATSEPSGSLVTMNNEEISRTPLGREFQWYGYYDTTVQADGYETLKQVTPVVAPPWLWFPFDFVAEIIPITIRDVREVHFVLEPTEQKDVAPAAMINRAKDLQTQLQSGLLTTTKPPTTRPATKPATSPKTKKSS